MERKKNHRSQLCLQGHTTVRQHCITFANDDTVHTQEKELTHVAHALGAPVMHQTGQELIRRQGNKPEGSTKNYFQVHEFGCSTERMLHGNQQQW